MKRWRAAWVISAALACAGCATLAPRFDPAVTASFAHDSMRKFESASLELYYPAQYHAEAMRVAGRLESCIGSLRKLPRSQTPRAKFLVYLTSANFNNAYVQPETGGYPQQMVLAHHLSLELFNWFELGEAEIGDISCHEAVHYVQMQEVNGFWRAVNFVVGSGLQPNVFTESWFLEGIATHYEGRLGKETGRPSSPFWRGMFESGAALREGNLNPGDLSPENRELAPFGGNYVVGMQFVDYLARTYGERKLWELIDLQGRSIFSPFGVALRFKAIYGTTLGGLFDDFSAELKRRGAARVKPSTQQTLAADQGYMARIAVSPSDGAIASVTGARDDVVRLTIREKDGRVRFSNRLAQILPPRRWIVADPLSVSGMGFTQDGASLYLVSVDATVVGDDVSRLWQVDARTGDVRKIWDNLQGLGGSVSPDGRRYVYIHLDGDTANLVEVDLATDRRTQLTHFVGRTSLGAPAYAPDGRRIAFSRFTGDGFDLFLRAEDGHIEALTSDGRFNYGARWAGERRLVFLRETDGRAQVHALDLASHRVQRLSDVPFIALDPSPTPDGKVVLLNRSGWSWSIDEIPLTGAADETPAPPVPLASQATDEDPPAPPGIDTAYSAWDHLLWPVFHSPVFFVEQSPVHTGYGYLAGISLSGSDRLGLHNYAANVYYEDQLRGPQLFLGYGNYQLAPWYLAVTGARSVGRYALDYVGSVSASRTFWTSPVSFGFSGLETLFRYPGYAPFRARLFGPNASMAYSAVEGTAYGGGKRGLSLSIFGSFYPKAFHSDLNLADVGGSVTTYVPLPGLKRHSLLLQARGRSLPGAPDGLLQVGGFQQGIYEYESNAFRRLGPIGDLALPGGLSFGEFLRGYEDLELRVRGVAIASARYRYPFIIDRGWASTLYVFPSLFVREVDVEGFFEGARTVGSLLPWHRAVGAAVLLHVTFGQAVPVTLYYQVSERLDDGRGKLQLFGLALQ